MLSTSQKTYGVADEAGVVQLPPHPHWAIVTIFQLVYSLVNAGMALFVLPLEAERLNGNGSLWVGIYLALCGLTQVICPIAGKISDRHASQYGRRRPFIILGTITTVLAFAAMRIASTLFWPRIYFVGLFFAEIGMNLAYAAHCGLPADLQGIEPGSTKAKEPEDEDTEGIISGYMSLHSFVGSICAMSMIVVTRHLPVHVQYEVYIVCLVFACSIICTMVNERPSINRADATGACLTVKDLRRCFCLDLKEDMNFFWVCASRMFYYGSISSSVFMYYYLRDMIIPGNAESSVRAHVAELAVVSQVVGALCSIPSSQLSNRIGRKLVIYAANTIMSITFGIYIFAPQFVHFAWPIVLFGGTLYGLGAATYMSVDYALALECLPSGKTTAEAFGLWGIAGFLGSTVGPLIGGVLLWLPSSAKSFSSAVDSYPYAGYVLVMMVTGPIMNAIGAWLVAQIVGLKEDDPKEVL